MNEETQKPKATSSRKPRAKKPTEVVNSIEASLQKTISDLQEDYLTLKNQLSTTTTQFSEATNLLNIEINQYKQNEQQLLDIKGDLELKLIESKKTISQREIDIDRLINSLEEAEKKGDNFKSRLAKIPNWIKSLWGA